MASELVECVEVIARQGVRSGTRSALTTPLVASRNGAPEMVDLPRLCEFCGLELREDLRADARHCSEKCRRTHARAKKGLPVVAPPHHRFWSRVDKRGPLGCWQWTAGKLTSGYGSFRVGNRAHVAHKYAYEALRGPVPEGKQLDHLCRNRACVNPDHLEPVPQRVNCLRGISLPALNARKTHCIHGHEFTPSNTYVNPKGHRGCRICRASRKAEWDAAHRSSARPQED